MQSTTFFVPTDQAWNQTFNMTNFQGFENITCSNSTTNLTGCYALFTQNLSTVRVEELAPCLPLISVHHVAGGNYDKLYNSTSGMNITVIPCGVNNAFSPNFTEFLVVNTTSARSYVQGGGNSTALITNSYPGQNGHLYVIDRVLVPQLPLNYTLISLNSTQPFNATLNDTMSMIEDRNVTVFLPYVTYGNQSLNTTAFNTTYSNMAPFNTTYFNMTSSDMAPFNMSSFNLTSYIVPEVIFLNQTSPTTLNLTALDGTDLIFDVTENYTATLNGNVSIIYANIPLTNGVLHLINGTVSSANITNTAAASTLQKNRDQWNRWIREHY
jgi:uncharacterized surface protein with fasciclin (FAS1) repeats